MPGVVEARVRYRQRAEGITRVEVAFDDTVSEEAGKVVEVDLGPTNRGGGGERGRRSRGKE